jgi:hypothetical protein
MRTSRLLLAALVLLPLAACDGDPTGAYVPSWLDCDRVSRYSVGRTAHATLSSSDCVLPEDGTFVDYYEIDISSRRDVTFTMRSNDVDPFLILYDEDGTLVAYDDDSDPQTTYGSRMDLNLPSGRYYLAANAVYEGETGDYELDSY